MRKKHIIGVDVGGTNVKIGIISLSGKIYKKKVFSTKAFSTKDRLIKALITGIKAIMAEGGLRNKDILGIGIGTPGLIDSNRGIIHYLVNIRGFKKVPLKKIIEKKCKIPTFLDNDVNIMCLGELYYGGAKGLKDVVCLTLGTGVGGGIAIDGRLYRGASLSAGEIGHTIINEEGPFCGCGNYGCVEAYVGNAAIVKDALRRVRKNKKTLIYKSVDGDLSKITPKVISQAAKKGDRIAKEVLKDTGRHLGVALASVVNILNPEKIIIGGGVAEAGGILFEAIRASVKKRAMKVPSRAVQIVKTKFGKDAGLIGAAALVKEKLGC